MFNAPEIFTNIPDIAQIYAINDEQIAELEDAVDQMNDNIFLDSMNEEMIARWEKMLDIIPLDDDTLDDRRFRVKSKVLEKLPYSYRVILAKLDTLCPDGYQFIIDEDRLSVETKLALKSKRMITDVDEMLEDVLPLNMTYVVSILWNQYETLARYTHEHLASYTQKQLRENVFEEDMR